MAYKRSRVVARILQDVSTECASPYNEPRVYDLSSPRYSRMVRVEEDEGVMGSDRGCEKEAV